MELLQLREPIDEPNPFTAEVKQWKSDQLYIAVSWGRDEQSAVIAWDLSKHRWRVVSREAPAKG
jgi:hypothetical protein